MSEEMLQEIFSEVKRKMNASIEALIREMGTIRTGRASLSLLDGITVDYYGTSTPLNQVATLSAPEGSLLTIQPWDASVIAEIEKVVLRSDLGLTPSSDGKIIRLPIPPLTEERRKQLAKKVSRIGEDGKTAVRQIRREGNDQVKELEKAKDISQDDEHRAYKEIQDLTDEFTKKIDGLVKKKEGEILEI
jgi:ribosome recycling factor